jgi:hypothetical protein
VHRSGAGPTHGAAAAVIQAGARHSSQRDAMLSLQRSAGNRAVTTLTKPVSVQRHASWEHALLGDTPPGQLGRAAVTNAARNHVLIQEGLRMRFFQTDPRGNPTARFPDITWIQLRASGLWVSNGELNALGDYLPDPSAYDTMPAEQLIPVLQRMRRSIMDSAGGELDFNGEEMAGQADSSWLPGAAGEVRSLDAATKQLGTNRYQGLLSRNACHFAPFSWERWALFHNEASDEALAHHEAKSAVTQLGTVDLSVEEHERQALLKNGYADHFLQDSFAAGHLVNKTLVMQWFVDYINDMSWLDRPWLGLPISEHLDRMASARQPGVAGMDRYARPPSSEHGSGQDRALGDNAIDPQSAQERYGREGRIAGSGVSGSGAAREANYQAYLAVLNSAFLNLSAGAVHDYFNERGLSVVNGEGTELRVGGDSTLLSQSDEIGAATAGRAASMSRGAVEDLLIAGATDKTVDAIFALVPQQVRVYLPDGSFETVNLAEFQYDVIRPLCWSTLFPEVIDSWQDWVVRMVGGELVGGGMSVDSGTAAPPPAPMGDFEVPSGTSRAG